MPKSHQADFAILGTSKLSEENFPVVQAVVPITGDDDSEQFGEVELVQSLGLIALPAPPSDDGEAEGLVLRNVAGADGIVIGGRDSRTAKYAHEMVGGDTCLHATHPGDIQFASRLFLKKGSASLVVGNKAVLSLSTDSFKVANKGAFISIEDDGSIVLMAKGGSNFVRISQEGIHVSGSPVMLGPGPFDPVPASPTWSGAVYGGPSPGPLAAGVNSTTVFVSK